MILALLLIGLLAPRASAESIEDIAIKSNVVQVQTQIDAAIEAAHELAHQYAALRARIGGKGVVSVSFDDLAESVKRRLIAEAREGTSAKWPPDDAIAGLIYRDGKVVKILLKTPASSAAP